MGYYGAEKNRRSEGHNEKTGFFNFISSQSPESLEAFLLSLFDSNEAFRNIVSSAISADEAAALFDAYEKKLDDCFNIESFSMEEAKDILSEFMSAIAVDPAAIADMNLVFAEGAVWLTNEFGDFEDEFYGKG